MNSTTLKQMTKDETEPVEAKNLMQISKKFCEVFALKISFLCPQSCSTLFVGRACIFIICHLTNFYGFAYMRA